MAIAYVQTCQVLGPSSPSPPSTISVPWTTANITTGNVVVLSTLWTGTDGIASIVDSAGNTYTYVQSLSPTNSINIALAYAPITVGGGTKPTITCNYTGSGAGYPGITAFEFSGLSATLDGTSVSTVGTSASVSPGTLTTTNANDLLFTSIIAGGSIISGPATWVTSIDANGCSYSYKIVSATSAYNPVSTQDSSNVFNAIFFALKMASSGSTQQGSVTSALGRTVTATAKHFANASVVI